MSNLNPALHHHPLAEEFGAQREGLRRLKLESSHFRSLMHQYEGLDKEVARIEAGIETPSDIYTETLKKERLFLKDQIAAALSRA